MCDFNPGWEAIDDQPTDFGLQDGDEVGKVAEIFFCTVNGCGEMTLERAGDGQDLVAAGMTNQKGGRAENLFFEIRVQKSVCISFEYQRAGAKARGAGNGRLSDNLDLLPRLAPGNCGVIGVVNDFRQKMKWGRSGDQLCEFSRKLLGFGSCRQEHHSRLRTELARPQGE